MAKREHFWEIVGEDISDQGRGQLDWCGRCEQFRWDDGEPFRMSWDDVEEMFANSELEGL